jgi:hypothetical protein
MFYFFWVELFELRIDLYKFFFPAPLVVVLKKYIIRPIFSSLKPPFLKKTHIMKFCDNRSPSSATATATATASATAKSGSKASKAGAGGSGKSGTGSGKSGTGSGKGDSGKSGNGSGSGSGSGSGRKRADKPEKAPKEPAGWSGAVATRAAQAGVSVLEFSAFWLPFFTTIWLPFDCHLTAILVPF